jgi:hypothetical protein
MSPLLATAFPDFAVLFLGLAIALLLFRFNWSIQCQATGDDLVGSGLRAPPNKNRHAAESMTKY